MKKYDAKLGSEILGIGILGYQYAQNYDKMEPVLTRTLADCGLSMEDIQPTEWYPAEITFQFFKELESGDNGMFDLVSIGMNAMEHAPFPPEVDSILSAVSSIKDVYSQNIRNYYPDEGYTIEVVSDSHIRLIDNTPYPHNLLYGYFYAISNRFSPDGQHAIVTRTFLNEENPDEDGAIYDITWS